MHLVETYARTTGLRIDKMLLTEHFYPLGIEGKYIVIVTGSGAPGKNYSHFKIVMKALKPLLHANGFKIVQVGTQEDERIGADVDVCGATTQYQYFDIISKCDLVLSGDTSAIHVAGHYDKKVVSLFSVSHPKISGAYFGNNLNQTYLTPSEDWRPSFNPVENPKQIDNIMPERVIQAVAAALGFEAPSFDTLYIGHEAKTSLLDTVPNAVVRPDFYPNIQMQIRFDKGGDERLVYEQLKVRKATLITDKPLDIQALKYLRPNIEGVIYLVGKDDNPSFAEAMHRHSIPYRLISLLPEEELREKKLSYIDFNLLERREPKTKELVWSKDKINENTKFSSNKRILSNGHGYLSYAHVDADKHLDIFTRNEDTIIDTPSFWEDVLFYHIFNT